MAAKDVKKSGKRNAALEAEMAADHSKSVLPPPDQLARIVAATTQLKEIRKRIAKGELLMQQLEAEERRLAWTVLPALLDTAGVRVLALTDDNEQLVRGQEVYASVSKENMGRFAMWLNKHKMGDIVKHEITIELARGDDRARNRIVAALAKLKAPFVQTSGIHSSTLKAWAKEQLEKGKLKLPKELKVHLQPTVEIKELKKSVTARSE